MSSRLYIVIFCTLLFATHASAQDSRIKDLVNIKGHRTNELMGFGLIVGLNGTGDTPASISTNQAMSTLLKRLGMDPGEEAVLTQATAAVVVTGKLPSFSRAGDKIDVKVSILGDAASLAGGTLLSTPLRAGDGQVYVVAQGPVVVAQATGAGAQTVTVAQVPSGGQVERSFSPSFVSLGKVELSLRQPDFTTSSRITRAINQHFRGFYARSVNPALIVVELPERFREQAVEFIAEMELLRVEADQAAVVVLNERTGTVVMGGDIRISQVVLSHNGLSLAVGQADNDPQEEALVPVEGTTVGDLVKSLNAMGVKPQDLISILQSMHASGALKAEIRYL
ncbi:MAG: flagellar basal body P-ring protein FlgI [Oligoflexus sp.]